MNLYLLILLLLSQPLSLDDCIELALKHNPSLIKAQEELKKREAEFSLSISEFLPQIRTTMGHTSSSKEHLSYAQPEQYATNFSLSQPIFDPENSFTTLGRKRLRDASKEYMKATRRDVILAVGEAYFELARRERLLELAKFALKRSEEEYKKVETMMEIGSTSRLDLLRRGVDLSERRLDIAEAKKDRAIKETRLCKEMGIEPTGIETVGGSINPELIEVSLDTLIKKAIENRPEISGKRLELAYYRDEYKSAYTNYLPKINLTSNYGYLGTKFPGERTVWDENDQWNIGINLNFDLFTGFGRHERIKSAKSDTYIKEQELKEIRLNVILDVKEAWLTLVNAQEELKLTKKNLELARENYKYVNESYKLGAGTILELIDAEESLRKANYKRTDALYNWKLAKIRLKRATGKSLL